MARMKTCVRAALGGVLIGASALASAGLPTGTSGHAVPSGERSDAVLLAASSGTDHDQGYRDGYGKEAYRDKYRSNKSYAQGFKAGQADRARGVASAQRPGVAAASGRPRSLVGHNADDLENEMKAIGYTWRAGTMKGRDSHTTWRGATDNQCVLAVSRNGKVASVSDIAPSSCR
jgi:hypothetical protein